MRSHAGMTKEELLALRKESKTQYRELQGEDLKLDIPKDKPYMEQLDLSMGLMDVLNSNGDLTYENGTDCRNYGVLTDIDEAEELIVDMMEVNPPAITLCGNSSLNVMYGTVSWAMTRGIMGNTSWCKLGKVKFLCPVPGYDRHFAVTGYFGIEMVDMPTTPQGPDMDMVEELVSSDDTIEGTWCMPKYSNSRDYSYLDKTVRHFARLGPTAPDFRISWNDAYSVHHPYDHDQDHLIEILAECKRSDDPDMVYKFASTSKTSFPGPGIAALATSHNDLGDIEVQLKNRTVGHDKVNQLRHVRFFGDIHGMVEHMRKHTDIVHPKFEAAEGILERELGGLGIGRWSQPKDGYSVFSDSVDRCAKKIVIRCKKAGVVMTPIGVAHPYGKNPYDGNVRITPTYPPLGDLIAVPELSALYVGLTSAERLPEDMD